MVVCSAYLARLTTSHMPNNSSSRRTIVLIAILLVLIIGGAVLYFVSGGRLATFLSPVPTPSEEPTGEVLELAQEDPGDQQDLGGQTKVQIRAFHDDNGDGQYGDATKPDDPSFEGTYFISADIDIIDEATGQQVNLVPICNNNGHLGGVGREFCNLPNGSYTVQFNGDVDGLTGPLKSLYNPAGVNPVAKVVVTATQKPIVEFGYTGTPDKGVLLIRKYVDMDNNAEYGTTGAHSETSDEGVPFFDTTYKLFKVTGSTKTPVDPANCFAGDFKFGGVGRDYCWVPAGTYEVDIDPNPDPSIYSGPFAETHNGNGDDPARVTVIPQETGGSTPAIIDFGYVQNKVTLQVRAFHDDNGDGQYGDGSNNPSFEGAYFISADYDVINQATGQPANLNYPVCNNSGHLGGVGRDFCRLPAGNYTVRFNGDVQGLIGPLKSANNPNGVNPMTNVAVSATAPATTEFGYTGTSTNGVLLIRKYVDLDNNNEYGGGAASETSAEGAPFSGTTYKLFSVSGSTKTPVDPKNCFAGDFKLGGVGRDYCWVPPGTYEVDVDNPDKTKYTGPFVETHNSKGTDPAQVTVVSRPEGAGNPDILDFGYKPFKKQAQKIVAGGTVARCEGGNVVDQLASCSQTLFKNPRDAQGIYLCRDDLFFDCFTGTPVMQKRQMTFLATNTASLSANTRTEINRILDGRSPTALSFIIAGQTDAVSAAVQRDIEAMGFKVTRIGGSDRRATARVLAEDLVSLVPSIDTIEISEDVVGMDAIAISPVAARALSTNGNKERAILLTKRTGNASGSAALDPNVTTFINAHKNQIKKVEIIGGPDAVPLEVDQELKAAFPGMSVVRISGDTRFDTTAQIDTTYFTSPTQVVLAFGKPVQPAGFKHGLGEYAALTGARIAAFRGAPLVLSDTDSIPLVIKTYLQAHASSIVSGEIVGSLSLVPKAIADEFAKLIQ
jgi:hypothetical protein